MARLLAVLAHILRVAVYLGIYLSSGTIGVYSIISAIGSPYPVLMVVIGVGSIFGSYLAANALLYRTPVGDILARYRVGRLLLGHGPENSTATVDEPAESGANADADAETEATAN